MEVIFGDMSNTIDTLLALSVTLEAVTAGKHELNESGYNVSDAWSQLAEGKVTLIEYLENEYHLGHYKSPLIKRLELALMAAEDKINAAFKDANGDVYHDWKAVAGLCQEWISTINGYYRYNPEPGTIAHAFLKMMKEPPRTQARRQSVKPRQKSSDAAMRLGKLTDIYEKLVEEKFIVDNHWQGNPALFWTLVYELYMNYEIDNGGLAWMDVARWVDIREDGIMDFVKSAQEGYRSNKSKKARGQRAALLRSICKK